MSLESIESGEKYDFHVRVLEFGDNFTQIELPTATFPQKKYSISELHLASFIENEEARNILESFLLDIRKKIDIAHQSGDAYVCFHELGALLLDSRWKNKLPTLSGYNDAVNRALPIYLRLLSDYLGVGVFAGGAHDTLSAPQQKETLLKFIQFHEGRLKDYIRSNDEDGVFMYRGILPSVCMNYALVSLYREDFETALDLIQRGFQAAIQTKSRVLAIKTIIIYLRLLNNLRDREEDKKKKQAYLNMEKVLYESIGKSCSFLQGTEGEFDEVGKLFESFKHGEEPDWYKSIRSQYFIAKFLALPSENGQLPLQAYNACSDADPEDKMLYISGRIRKIASGATNHIDEVMGLIEKNHEKDHFIILIPSIASLIEKYLSENSIEGKNRVYLERAMVYISRFLRRKEKQREGFEGLSWYQEYLRCLRKYFSEVQKDENAQFSSDAVLLSQVEIIDRTLQNSFHERYKQYFPLLFQVPFGKDIRIFSYDQNGLKEIKKMPANIEFHEVTIPGGSWNISGTGLHTDINLLDICKGIVPNLRQNLVNQSLSKLSAELIESLGAIDGSLSMYVQDIGEVQHATGELKTRIVGLLSDGNDPSLKIIEDIASNIHTRLGGIMEDMKSQSVHIPDTLQHLQKQLTELSGLAAFDLSLPEIGGYPNDGGE